MLKEIEKSIASHLREVDRLFVASSQSHVALLDVVLRYVLRGKGKRIRPILVLLTSGVHGRIDEGSYRAAALVELLHTATLIHDDVVDGAGQRRGLFSIPAVWKNKVAVLVGDFLFSRTLGLSLTHKDDSLLRVVNQAVVQITEGELLQLQKLRKVNMREKEYLQIIEKKTASLLAACCQMGALVGGASSAEEEQMRRFGLTLGLVFQMRDDLFDYEHIPPAGKPLGLDLQERKMTLPLLHALSVAPLSLRRSMRSLLTQKKKATPKVRQQICDFVRRHDGIAHTRRCMEDLCHKAQGFIEPLPDSSYKRSLLDLVAFCLQRKR